MAIGKMRLDGSEPGVVFHSNKPIITFNMSAERFFISVGNEQTPEQILVVPMGGVAVEREFAKGTAIICTVGDGSLYYADAGDSGAWFEADIAGGHTNRLQ
jgi:hypothetical protein